MIAMAFDYSILSVDDRRFLKDRAQQIRGRVALASQQIVEMGEMLIEAKSRLPHGQFGGWVRAEFDWTDRTARQMMNVAEKFKSENFSDLQIAPSALYLLAAPSTPTEVREEFFAAAKAGSAVTHAAVRVRVGARREAVAVIGSGGEVAAESIGDEGYSAIEAMIDDLCEMASRPSWQLPALKIKQKAEELRAAFVRTYGQHRE